MAMPKKDQRETMVFKKPEIFLQTKCSVHPWMGAYLAIIDHPFFDVTGPQGKFTLKNLPVGSYTIEAWHEVFGTIKKEIIISDDRKIPELNFEFKKVGQ
jgi:hypothetical protein